MTITIQVPKEVVEDIILDLVYAASCHIRLPAIRTKLSPEKAELMAYALDYRAAYWQWLRDHRPIFWRNRYRDVSW